MTISWFFTKGTVLIRGNGCNQTFKLCNVSQFINILKDPKNPQKVKTLKIDQRTRAGEQVLRSRVKQFVIVEEEKLQNEKNFAPENLLGIRTVEGMPCKVWSVVGTK